MSALPFDRVVSKRLQSKYSLVVSILPFACAFLAAFLPSNFLARALAAAFGVAANVPVRDEPKGWLWLGVFLAVMIVLAVVGYLMGFVFNALIMHWAVGWSWPKVREVFLFSQVPTHWLNNEPTIPAAKHSFKVTIVLIALSIIILSSRFWLYQPKYTRFAGIAGSVMLLVLFLALNFTGYKSQSFGKKVLFRAYLVSFSLLTVWQVVVFHLGGTIPWLAVVALVLMPSFIYLLAEFRPGKSQ
jgi:hypothetical protein